MPEFAGVDVHDLLRIRPATAGVRSLKFTGGSWPLCWSGEFFFNDLTDNMVIDNFFVVLRTMDQAMGTELVNQAGGAGGVTEDLTDCRVRENILAGPGIIEMSAPRFSNAWLSRRLWKLAPFRSSSKTTAGPILSRASRRHLVIATS